jgi:hypothetical protein
MTQFDKLHREGAEGLDGTIKMGHGMHTRTAMIRTTLLNTLMKQRLDSD